MSRVDHQQTSDRKAPRSSAGRRRAAPKSAKAAAIESTHTQVDAPPVPADIQRMQLIYGALVLAAGIWAYWPTLVTIVTTWNQVADYSHGFLVVPVAIYFLWARRASCPGIEAPAYGLGFGLLLMASLVRYAGARFFLGAVDGYSILIWIASVVAICGGRRLLVWSLPSIGFLFFMIPLPFGIETAMSLPLQRLATRASCVTLQTLGREAFAEGNQIHLGNLPDPLEVAQACSGLRLFMSMVALCYTYLVLVRRTWWEKAILVAATVPIAIMANVARISATGLLYEFTTGQIAHQFAHDYAGYAMIPLAATMFGLVLWYLGLLIQEEEVLDMSAVLRDVRV